MDASVQVEGSRSLLRWGGLAGLLGGALMLFVFVFVGAVVGPDPAGLHGPVARFPQIGAARTLENSLYLAVMAMWILHVVALAHALQGAGRAPALLGGALGISGLTILAAGALPHVVTSRLSALYHAPGATPADQAAIVLLWQLSQGIFDALLAAGLILLPIGVVALGLAMRRARAFGRAFGGATIALGVIGLAGAAAFVVDPASPFAVVGFLVLIAFNLVLGWKALRLSSAHVTAQADLVDRRMAGGLLSS